MEKIKNKSIEAFAFYIKAQMKAKSVLHSVSKRITDDERGQGIVEYGIVLAVVALLLIGPLTTLRESITAKLNQAAQAISGAGVGG